ncbi:DUF805 domain-containing protein [Sphingosinicella sp. YJ22]|uniref:DUF805 domain-containing protein n=1 Tax=Sphingosinicella sp. YJ22 TaxID=1104780 RepID=UPI00140E7730|nr:DUF805 domain-containing protein [Sphingosinicella sp. YJ22]
MNWMLMPLRRYADFNGRSRRKEYWMWTLFNLIVGGILGAILMGMIFSATARVAERGGVESYEYSDYDSSDSGFSYESGSSTNVDPTMFMEEFSTGGWILIGLLCLWWLFTLIPNLAVTIRRLHDQDKSGWMILLAFIPLVGGIILLVFMLLDGTRGPNRFGPDPKGPGHTDTFG